MTNISGAQFLRGNNRAGLGDKTPFQAGGRHPRLEFCFLVPGPGRQADKRLEAQFIFWFLMRGGGQGGEPALLRNMLTFSRGRCWTRDRRSNILGTSRLRTQWWPGCATLLQSTVEKMGSRPCPPFNPSSCPTGWRDGSRQQQQRVFGSSSLTGRKLPLEAAAGRQQQLEGHGRDTATRAASRVGDAPNY